MAIDAQLSVAKDALDAIVQLLVGAGADTGISGAGAPGFSGKSALDLANDLGRSSIAKILHANK